MPEDSSITIALPNDLEALTKISFAAKRHWNYPEEWIQMWAEDLTITREYVLTNNVYKLLATNKEIIGFCAIEDYKNYFEVGHLWILPAFMGLGHGKALLNHSIKSSLCEYHLHIDVIADPNAESFYAKCGFETIEQVSGQPQGRKLPKMRRKV